MKRISFIALAALLVAGCGNTTIFDRDFKARTICADLGQPKAKFEQLIQFFQAFKNDGGRETEALAAAAGQCDIEFGNFPTLETACDSCMFAIVDAVYQ